jgi:DNA-binding transcriptional ArsR family regulator
MMACAGEVSRFQLVRALVAGERCVTELAAHVGLSQSCTTRHLQALARDGLVRRRRDGRRVMFRLRSESRAVVELLEWVLSHGGESSPDGAIVHGEHALAYAPHARGRRNQRTRRRAIGHPGAPIEVPAGHSGPPALDMHEHADHGDADGAAQPVLRSGDLEDFLL